MCAIHDTSGYDDHLIRIHLAVQGRGWAVAAVEGGPGCTGWAYTIGLLEHHDHPELVMVGAEEELAASNLNGLAARVTGGLRLDRVESACCDCGADAWVHRVHRQQLETGLLPTWSEYYGALGAPLRPRALQLAVACLPDTTAWRLDRPEPALARAWAVSAHRGRGRHRRG